MEESVEMLGLYKDIGKKTRGLLYKDFQSGLSLKLGNPFLRASYLSTKIHLEDFTGLQNLSSHISLTSGEVQVGLDIMSPYAGISTCLGLTAHPIFHFSALAGSKVLALGADVSLNTASWDFDKCNFGLSSSSGNINVSLAVNNWGDTVKASFHHLLSPATSTAVSVEIAHTVSSNERKVAIGAQHALNSRCSVKARLSSGRVGIVTKHPLGPHIVTFFGEADLKDIKASAMGLGLALRF